MSPNPTGAASKHYRYIYRYIAVTFTVTLPLHRRYKQKTQQRFELQSLLRAYGCMPHCMRCSLYGTASLACGRSLCDVRTVAGTAALRGRGRGAGEATLPWVRLRRGSCVDRDEWTSGGPASCGAVFRLFCRVKVVC